MTTPEDTFTSLVPKINKSFSTDGKGRRLLLNAFVAAGLPFDENNFPTIVYDGSVERIALLFSDSGYYTYTAVKENTIFGDQITQIVIHPQTLYLAIEEKLHEMAKEKLSAFILYAAGVNAIDAIVTQVTNAHGGENEDLRDAVLLEFIRQISPQDADDFKK